jgi:drug/metabolite transporter (DMT)-like permease
MLTTQEIPHTVSPPNNNTRPIAGPLLMLAAALIFAVLDGLIKLMDPAFRVWDIAFLRWGGSFALLVVFFGWKGTLFQTNNPKLMVIRSLTGCITFFLLITAIRSIPLSTAMILFFTFPAFAALFSWLLFGESISKLQILCIGGTIAGVAVLLDFKIAFNLSGYIMALLAGMFAGFTVCLIKKLRDHNGPVVIYLYFCLLGAAISFPMFIANPVIPQTGLEWLMASGIAGTAVAGQLLMNQGFKYCKSWEGGLYLTAEAVFTAILGIVVLGELTNGYFWAGGVLILASVILLQLTTAGQVLRS